MYARVARWEGGDAAAMRRAAEQIGTDAASGPPEGVPAKGFVLLIGPDNGRGLGVALFATEEDLRKGDEVLSSMSPPDEGLGKRTSWRCTRTPPTSGSSSLAHLWPGLSPP
jgi:hypothetical protein